MKKKLAGLLVAGVAVFALSGCGGGDDYYPPVDDLVTLLIVNQHNVGIDGIRYVCDSTSGFTGDGPLAGEFTFRDFDDCDFYLEDSIVWGDDLFIVDSSLRGKNNIYYYCASGIDGFTGDTGLSGEFLYSNGVDDICTFEF